MPEHLAQGSSEPALSPGKLRLYGMRFCPYDHRVHLVLIAKNIQHDNVFINLKNKPDWYVKKIPSTKVPGLLVDNEALYESLIISDFLDEKYPQHPLHSKDPLQKAKDRILIENFGKVGAAFYKVLLTKEPNEAELLEPLITELIPFDKDLAERGTKFFGGKEPGMVDHMIWPWFERLSAFKILFGRDLPEAQIKHLVSWIKLMKEDSAVKEYFLGGEIHAKYIKGYISGTPDFNIAV